MKFLYVACIILFLAGCASSSNNEKEKEEALPNLVTLQQPKDQPHEASRVYIDSVKQITADKKTVLLISGTFPDACTYLQEATHQINDGSLYLHFSAWKNPETMCAQVLTSFSFIYDELSEKELSAHSQVIINDTSYSY